MLVISVKNTKQRKEDRECWRTVLNRMIGIGLAEISDYTLEEDEGVSHVYMLRTVLRRENSKCKGLEVGVCQVYLENIARRPMWLGQRKQGEIGWK